MPQTPNPEREKARQLLLERLAFFHGLVKVPVDHQVEPNQQKPA